MSFALCVLALPLPQASSTTFGIDPNAPPPLDDDTTVVVPRIQVPSQLCLDELQTLDALDHAYDADYGISCYCSALRILATIV